MSAPDVDYLRQWIGRTESRSDSITRGLVERFRATLADLVSVDDDRLPLALHWCLAPPAVPESETGADGHPARGGFLPPIDDARRMWGGGEVEFIRPFQIGETVERQSRIATVDVKSGRSGGLVIVGVDHEYQADGNTAVRERQNIVYRLSAPPQAVANERKSVAPGVSDDAVQADHIREGFASSLLMFRYSALTFNGHRIHYDRDYAMQEEGYPGLVFHGPLQATLLANFAQELNKANPLKTFAYKGVSPLFGGSRFSLNANRAGNDFSLWVADEAGQKTMTASAGF